MGSDLKPRLSKKSKGTDTYLKYSGLAIQILITLALAGWGGYVLDQKMGWKFPFALLGFIFIAFAGIIILLYRSINAE